MFIIFVLRFAVVVVAIVVLSRCAICKSYSLLFTSFTRSDVSERQWSDRIEKRTWNEETERKPTKRKQQPKEQTRRSIGESDFSKSFGSVSRDYNSNSFAFSRKCTAHTHDAFILIQNSTCQGFRRCLCKVKKMLSWRMSFWNVAICGANLWHAGQTIQLNLSAF